MPTASTSQIMGFTESFEIITSNIYKRKTLAGEFIIINKYLINDLIKLNLWNKDMKDKILINEGSIQSINDIPKEIEICIKQLGKSNKENILTIMIVVFIFVNAKYEYFLR